MSWSSTADRKLFPGAGQRKACDWRVAALLASGHAFVRHVGGRLAELPGVEAVTLGGSRAEGTSRPDSDWDFSLYYWGRFEPRSLREVGSPGEVSEIGGWGAGVFNGVVTG